MCRWSSRRTGLRRTSDHRATAFAVLDIVGLGARALALNARRPRVETPPRRDATDVAYPTRRASSPSPVIKWARGV